MSDLNFHPAVTTWFRKRFASPTPPQARAWPSIQAGRHTLIAAPTGSGKTLAAFLAALDDLVRQGCDGTLADTTQVVYVSPLKALSNDIRTNLQEPLAGIREELAQRGAPASELRVMVRTGDTPQRERQAMARRPPHLVVTTPESLYILLTSESGRRMLSTVRTVIVDEIHALAHDKRGSHLSLSLERLEALTSAPLTRIGLSATQNPIELVARFLVGQRGEPDAGCTIIDTGHVRQLDLDLVLPDSPLEAVMSNEVWEEVHERLAAAVQQHRTTLVFVNTRRLAERLARQLSERLGEEAVTSHHGSLSREHRLDAEQRLKAGELRALVATASLELGIDIGDVDLVCQIGSTRSIAAFLQRVGRSGHGIDRIPKGRLFPLSRDELVECVALLQSVRARRLDRLSIPEQPLDILAQQIVAAVACEEWSEDALFERVRHAWPYRHLQRSDFDDVLQMLSEGFSTRRGRRSAYLHRDLVQKRLRARRGARLAAITSGGAIPDNADYRVVLEPGDTFVGTVNEDFAVESMAGDVFQLGNASWRIRRVEPGRVRVEDARGQPPSMPFWLGEAPGRTAELSAAVSELRVEVEGLLAAAEAAAEVEAAAPESQRRRVGAQVQQRFDVPQAAAEQLVEYLAACRAALGVVPSQRHIVLERFFDEAGGMQLVVHAPFGSRLNRAWGLALRKRFCRSFNFELQAAANEDAIVLSLGMTHSFPLDDVARFLDAATVRSLLTQALLDAPMFDVRWRWNAGRALAIPRFSGGRKVAPQITRMQAEDLLSVVFPDQLACLENIAGDREIPDHPLVSQTIRDCLEEAMDIERLEQLLRDLRRGDVAFTARDLREPSPLALEILNARPYAFLDDAPLEERRTQAVLNRRWLDADSAADIGALDAAAIDRVREECWPQAETADELHDALVLLGYLTVEEGERCGWQALFDELQEQQRATRGVLASGRAFWVAVERHPQWLGVHPQCLWDVRLEIPATLQREWQEDEARIELLRGRLEALGPVTVAALATSLDIPPAQVEAALLKLESEGFVLRGRFTPRVVATGVAEETPSAPGDSEEWCERRLLSRIHRYTLKRLRSEIEPVSAQDFMRFLLEWQHVTPQARMQGPGGVAEVLEQLEGIAVAAAAWEAQVLPARVSGYDPAWLDQLCLSGKVVWARSGPSTRSLRATPEGQVPIPSRRSATPIRTTPIALFQRASLSMWALASPVGRDQLTSHASMVLDSIEQSGASFFHDLVTSTGLLRTQVEVALAELVAHGLLTADGFTGLRALLVPSDKRRPLRARPGGRGRAVFGIEDAGRWVGFVRSAATPDEARADHLAKVLLRRYGVVFRRILDREVPGVSWRELLRTYRRLEARGEIRGGRFVAGFTGEQYALPEAVGALRAVRRQPRVGVLVSVSAADPLNQVGILTPGERVPAHADNRILYEDGVPLAVRVAGEVRFLARLDAAREWQVRQALVQQQISPSLRSVLKHAG